MLFNSYIFIFLFFPLCLTGFYLLERKGKAQAARIWLAGFSLWFYGYFNLYYLSIMAVSILFNFLVSRLLLKKREERRKTGGEDLGHARAAAGERALLAAGICANLGLLFYFKYYDFFAENINQLFGSSLLLKNVLLPLGISFFTFQQIGFLTDVYRGEAGRCSFVEYALFVSFFPQLIAGPIVNYGEMMPQFRAIGKRTFSWEQFAGGLYLFTLGMAKKVLIADTFGLAVDYGYGDPAALNGTDAVLVMLFYTLQLYFDFSGYCDMARGLGHMLGIEIPVNFNSPYRASNIIDFWKRWHITLNRFLMRYVYIPLGGNRRGKTRMLLNLMLVFLVSGLWHGAGWNFLIWGALHGALYVCTRSWQLYRGRDGVGKDEGRPYGGVFGRLFRNLSRTAGVVCTFLFVNVAWVFFRAADAGQARMLFMRMLSGGFALPSYGIYDGFNLDEFWYVMKVLRLTGLAHSDMLLCAAFLIFALAVVFFHRNAGEMEARFRPGVLNMVTTAVLFLWCVLSLSGVSTFLYFNF